MKNRKNKTAIQTAPQQVRIIAGCWKGSKLPVIQKQFIRPTPNRVRETVFNWLQPVIAGSDCLDLFAGSGALGIEAVSRGAAHAVLVDSDRDVILCLQQQVERLQTNSVTVLAADVSKKIPYLEKKFDIVFLDPPFGRFDLQQLLSTIKLQQILKPNALIYIEAQANTLPVALPLEWSWRRQSNASEVDFGLIATGK